MTYIWVIWIAWWGAMVAYLHRLKTNDFVGFSWIALFTELTTSGLVGLMTFYLCDFGELDARITAVAVAVAGHMGTRAIFLIRNALVREMTGNGHADDRG